MTLLKIHKIGLYQFLTVKLKKKKDGSLQHVQNICNPREFFLSTKCVQEQKPASEAQKMKTTELVSVTVFFGVKKLTQK